MNSPLEPLPVLTPPMIVDDVGAEVSGIMSFGPNTAFDPTHVWIAKELVCGGIAASIGIVIGNPFDVIKVRLQTLPEVYSSPVKCFKDIVRYEGVGGLYKGLLSPVLAQFFIGALSFAANSATMKFLEPNLKKGESGQFHNSFIAGSVGGFAQCLVLVPTDLIKCKMQTDQIAINGQVNTPKYSSSYDCLRQIVRSEGVRGLFRGFVSTACREVPAFGIYFGSYTHMLQMFKSRQASTSSSSGFIANNDYVDYVDRAETARAEPPAAPVQDVGAILLSGGVAGALSWGVVYPVDVIKSNIQLSTTGGSVSMLSATRALYQRYGSSIFFRGFSTAVVRAFPVNAAVFFFYELFRGHLGI